MKRVKSLHNKAIEIAELAFKLKREGKIDRSVKEFSKAFKIEREAADLIPIDKKNEPSRSILYRSAGSLALNANLFIEAEKMVANGLLGFPPKEIADELRDLFDQINFERHLDLKGVKLSNNEFLFSLAGGSEVGHGYVRSEEFIKRIVIINDITLKEVERRIKKTVKNKKKPNPKVVQMYKPFLQTPKASSFQVVIQIGESQDNTLFPDYDTVSESIIEHILDSVELVNNSSIDKLRKKFENNEEEYFDHILTSIKNLAPDGKKVKMIGLKGNEEVNGKEVKFIRPHKDIKFEAFDLKKQKEQEKEQREKEGSSIVLIGILDFARSKKNEIAITDRNGKEHVIKVSEGRLAAIVKSNYEDEVKITGTIESKGKKQIIALTDLERVIE